MAQINPFGKSGYQETSLNRRDFLISAGIHGGILLFLVIAGVIFSKRSTIPTGGGEFVSVEMIVLDHVDSSAEAVEETVPVEEIEEAVEVEEVIEEQVEEVVETVEIEETTPVEEIEEVQEEVQEEIPQTEEFIGVGAQGEAGSGAPGPASYEGRVFSAIRRNFRTSVTPSQSYRIEFTVNLDGSTSYSTIRNSGDAGFDRAVTHAINSANIPPVPPGRSEPVKLSIEFFGPDSV